MSILKVVTNVPRDVTSIVQDVTTIVSDLLRVLDEILPKLFPQHVRTEQILMRRYENSTRTCKNSRAHKKRTRTIDSTTVKKRL